MDSNCDHLQGLIFCKYLYACCHPSFLYRVAITIPRSWKVLDNLFPKNGVNKLSDWVHSYLCSLCFKKAARQMDEYLLVQVFFQFAL